LKDFEKQAVSKHIIQF